MPVTLIRSTWQTHHIRFLLLLSRHPGKTKRFFKSKKSPSTSIFIVSTFANPEGNANKDSKKLQLISSGSRLIVKVYSSHVNGWREVDVHAVQNKPVTPYEPNANIMFSGFAHFLPKNLRDLKPAQQIVRVAWYMNESALNRFKDKWLNITHSLRVTYMNWKYPRAGTGVNYHLKAMTDNVAGGILPDSRNINEVPEKRIPAQTTDDKPQESFTYDCQKSILTHARS